MEGHDAEALQLQMVSADAPSCVCQQASLMRKRLGWFDRIYDPFKSVLFVCVLMPFFIKGEVPDWHDNLSPIVE